MDMFSYLLGKSAGGGGGGITPTGTINITQNGETDVTNYATANVNVSGGGGTPTTLAELNENYVTPFYNYMISLPNSYSTYTTDNITLYTPHADYTTYAIYKRDSAYRVVWFPKNIGFYVSLSSGSLGGVSINNNNYAISTTSWSKTLKFNLNSTDFYRTGDLNSIESCLSAIQNPNQYYYTADSAGSFVKSQPYTIPFTNTFVIENDSGVEEISLSQKISTNETIQVKS